MQKIRLLHQRISFYLEYCSDREAGVGELGGIQKEAPDELPEFHQQRPEPLQIQHEEQSCPDLLDV